MKKSIAAVLMGAALFALSPLAAKADTYNVIFSGPGGDSGNIDILVTGTTVTSISGITDGLAVTGLSSYAGADQQWNFPTAPYVDFFGISWSVVGGDAFGLGWTGSDYGLAEQSINPSGFCCGDHPINLQVAAVPGPIVGASLPGFAAAGVGLLIILGRRRVRRTREHGVA